MRDDVAGARVVVVVARNAVETQSEGRILPAVRVAAKIIQLIRDIEAERRGFAVDPVRESGWDAVQRVTRPTAVRYGERTVDDRERAHIEHVAARLGARQTEVDEIQI